jgi:hypothetical protein
MDMRFQVDSGRSLKKRAASHLQVCVEVNIVQDGDTLEILRNMKANYGRDALFMKR